MFPFPVIVLSLVFLLTAFRQVLYRKLRIWQIMSIGALAVLLSGSISLEAAVKSINADVMIFLFSMFVIGSALEESGYISLLSSRLFSGAKSSGEILFILIFGSGIASAFLLNDTLAIIGTPVAIMLSRKLNACAKPFLLALCFSVTVGSVMSPIGNPQNLLIAVNGQMKQPFFDFARFLAIPTIINLFAVFFVIKAFYPKAFEMGVSVPDFSISDSGLARLSKTSLFLLVFLVTIKMAISALLPSFDFKLTYIAVLSMLPVLLSKKRAEVVRKSDWRTLVFFASMFIVMESVWATGFFQSIIYSANLSVKSVPMIFIVGVSLSQLISNVPLASLYLPILMHAGAGTRELVSLAAASTIGGNLFILGAASNVIIIQNAERKGQTITFAEFAKIGIPLTVINILVYWIFLVVI